MKVGPPPDNHDLGVAGVAQVRRQLPLPGPVPADVEEDLDDDEDDDHSEREGDQLVGPERLRNQTIWRGRLLTCTSTAPFSYSH